MPFLSVYFLNVLHLQAIGMCCSLFVFSFAFWARSRALKISRAAWNAVLFLLPVPAEREKEKGARETRETRSKERAFSLRNVKSFRNVRSVEREREKSRPFFLSLYIPCDLFISLFSLFFFFMFRFHANAPSSACFSFLFRWFIVFSWKCALKLFFLWNDKCLISGV